MKKRIGIVIGAVLATMVFGAGALAFAAPTIPGRNMQREPTTCTHFIATDDGGQAFSLPAGAKVFSGEYLIQVPVSQAWKFCYPLSASGSHLIRLKADQSYAISGYKHLARIYKASVNSANQLWTKRDHKSPWYFRLLNRNGAMCVANGNGSSDVVETCSGAASHWITG
jgi:hypothetical protein